MSGSGSLRTFSKGLNFDKLTTLNAGIGGYYDTVDTVIRKYPPKKYNSISNEIDDILNSRNCRSIICTLNTDNITYGSGNYSIYYTPYIINNSNNAFKLFDNDISDILLNSAFFGTNYNGITGVYVGDNYLVDGTYKGEWVAIKLQTPIKLSNYKIHRLSTLPNNSPRSFKIYGSYDGIIWVSIDTVIDLSLGAYINNIYSKDIGNTNYYSYYAININAIFPNNETYCNFIELVLNGSEGRTTYVPVYGYDNNIGSYSHNAKLTITNNPYSWKTAIFKNIDSDYVSIGLYDLNSNSNPYIGAIDKTTDIFKDLYINNLGISSQPANLIGNVIINGKTTIGNSSNSKENNFILDVYSKTSNNLVLFRNSNSHLSFSVSNDSNFNINTSTNQIYINPTIYTTRIIVADNNCNLTSNAKLYINGNSIFNGSVNINGIISGDASGLSNIKINEMTIQSNTKIGANILNIASNSPLNINNNNQLYLNYDSNVFKINDSNQLSFANDSTGQTGLTFWLSADLDASDMTQVQKIFFNQGNSYVGIKNDNPLSCLFVGSYGNLLRVASDNVNDCYFSQLGTLDNIGNNNHTKIKLIAPFTQSSITSQNNYDVSGSIYYNISGNNPTHTFSYEHNNSIFPLMIINKQGTVFINSNNTSITNNEKLVVFGNVSIFNSNINNPARVIIGDSTNNNSLLQTFGRIIVGTSNSDANLYSLYINNDAKFNNNVNVNGVINAYSNVIVSSNLIIGGTINGNGCNLSNLKISSLFLDNSNNKLNANFLKINSNTGINVNSNNELFINYDTSKFMIVSNQLTLSNSIAGSSYWLSAQIGITDPSQVSRVYFNLNESYVGIKNDNPLSCLFVGRYGNLMRVASDNVNDCYFSQLGTVDSISNNNNTKIKLIAPFTQSSITSSNNYDISGSIYYNITGDNPTHTFNYESNGIISPLMIISRQGTVFINSNNTTLSNNEKLAVYGNVSIFNSNAANPARVIIGDSTNNNSLLQTFGRIIAGTSNSDANLYSLYINNDAKFNSNVNINGVINAYSNVIISSNLIIGGTINGNGCNLSNLKISSLFLDNSNNKLNANFLKINSNTGINVNSNNELFINYDTSKFMIASNQLTLSNSIAGSSYWLSAQIGITDPSQVSRVYFNLNESYVGIKNDNPLSCLFVGRYGNLMRVASDNVNDCYFSQLGTVDSISNNNNTKIKLIAPFAQSSITSSNNYDISGSIYYNITGNNPTHTFNYESNGVILPLMIISRQGTVFINSNNTTLSNNEKLAVYGNVSIFNSNATNPATVIIGDSVNNNSLLQTFGRIIVGTSNSDANLYSLYVNNNAKFNSNLVINCNLIIGGTINGNGCNLSNLKISSLFLDNSNNRLNANFLKINSNTGINVNSNNELFINYDTSKFMIASNQLTLSNSIAGSSYWLSAQIGITDPSQVSRVYFNLNESYVGIKNDNPLSCLFVGRYGNLMRVASDNVNDCYFSQLGTVDSISNNNNTKIKLIAPFSQASITSSNNYDISGSIYYNITGANPTHTFNYESNGVISPLMIINRQGTVFINSNSTTLSNNEKLAVYGNVSIFNSNAANPTRVIIGDSTNNNSLLQTFGRIIVGTSNSDANLFSLYVNSNVKFNSNVVINCNLIASNSVIFTNTLTVGQSATPALNLSGYQLNVNGNMGLSGNIFTISDETLKKNVKTYENALYQINNCRGVSFNYINDNNKINIGVIAQEIEKIIPEVVETNIDGIKNVNYLGLIGVLIEAIKELNKKIDNKI